MAKQTKRSRKFQATGGVKARIEKGTVTKHGKLRKRNKTSSTGDEDSKLQSLEEVHSKKANRSDDFLGDPNLGSLDLDHFFSKLSEQVEPTGDDYERLNPKVTKYEACNDGETAVSVTREEISGNSESESEFDSEDDDIEIVEARMKDQLSKIKQSDPDFHKFLKDNEESLLSFGHDSADGHDENEAMEEEQDFEERIGSRLRVEAEDDLRLTPKVLNILKTGALVEHNIKSLKGLIAAYKSACHLADSDDNEVNYRIHENKYIIDSPKVFDELMVVCLNHCHEAFHYHLLGPEELIVERKDPPEKRGNEFDKPINPKYLEKKPQWSRMKALIKSFFQSTIHLLIVAKDSELLAFVLKSLSKSIRFLTAFPRVADTLLKTLTSIWSAPLDSAEDYQVARLNSFFRIRQLAVTQPFPFIEDILKKTYLAYAKRAKFGASLSSLPTLTFMGNCLVELYSLDYQSSYQHAFVYIRQLALLLRNAMQKKTEESVQQVFCWQYFNCMKLWVSILCSAAQVNDGKNMRTLIYPLTEIILGTARFAPSPVKLMPSRFHCIRLLQQMAAASETFIPTASLLLDCLDWKEWYLTPLKTSSSSGRGTRGLQLLFILKLPGKTNFLRMHEHLESGINEFFLLLQREIELYRYSPGFPEFSIRIQVRLRQFARMTRNSRWRSFASACLEAVEKYCKNAVITRSKLSEAPKDVKRLECLLPIGGKKMQERHEESTTSEQKLLDAKVPAPYHKRKDPTVGENVDYNLDRDIEEQPKKRRQTGKKTKDKAIASFMMRSEGKKQLLGEDMLMKVDDHLELGVTWSDDDQD